MSLEKVQGKPIANRRKLGLPPGTPVFIGEQQLDNVGISYFQFNKDEINEGSIEQINTDLPELRDDMIIWLNVVGIHDVNVVKHIGSKFDIDPIVLEDIVDTSSRPRIEDMGDYFFIIAKDLVFDTDELELQQEHMAFIISNNFVLTFQEDEGDLFDTIRDRLRQNKGPIRKSSSDYLFNRLLDTIVDNYYLVVENIGTEIDELENIVISNPSRETLQTIQDLKSELIYTRRLILPVRELVGIISKLDHLIVSESTIVFVRSIYDHLNQIIDSVEIYREMLTGFLEIYLSSLSNRTNDVMKVLTIITSIFIPLSFLAGVYGMNFEHMPELGYRFSYPLLWLIFFTLSGTMVYYFKKLGWLKLDWEE